MDEKTTLSSTNVPQLSKFAPRLRAPLSRVDERSIVRRLPSTLLDRVVEYKRFRIVQEVREKNSVAHILVRSCCFSPWRSIASAINRSINLA